MSELKSKVNVRMLVENSTVLKPQQANVLATKKNKQTSQLFTVVTAMSGGAGPTTTIAATTTATAIALPHGGGNCHLIIAIVKATSGERRRDR